MRAAISGAGTASGMLPVPSAARRTIGATVATSSADSQLTMRNYEGFLK